MKFKLKLKLKRKRKMKKSPASVENDDPNETTSLLISPSIDEPPTEIEETVTRATNYLYISHLSAKFTETAWQFCLILFLTALTEYKSLFLVSTYGLFSGIVVCLAGAYVGAFVDSPNYSRLEIAQILILVQNLSVVSGTVCCFFLLRIIGSEASQDNETSGSRNLSAQVLTYLGPSFNLTSVGLLVAVHIFGAIGKLTDQGMTVAMERDWIVVMSKYAASDICDSDEYVIEYDGDGSISNASSALLSVGSMSVGDANIDKGVIRNLKEKTWLSQTNTTMTQIDLLCKVFAPAAAGIFLSIFDDNDPSEDTRIEMHHLSYAAMAIGILNLGSLYLEYEFIKEIFDLVPPLSVRQNKEQNIEEKEEIISEDESTIGCGMPQVPQSLKLYFEQPISLGGFALALLYMNVLTFGALMTSYLVWLGVGYNTIGILRGICSFVGILGTVAFHYSNEKKGLAFTGMWSILFQFGWLGVCFLSIFIKDVNVALCFLVIGVCGSRIGLWAFDLTITQYFQRQIPEEIRGSIGGVQKSLNGFFDLTTYALGLTFSDPSEFYILVATGYVAVGSAMLLYLFGVYKKREEFQPK